jgi:hypothetical protein
LFAQFHRYQTLSWHSVNTRDYDEDEYASRHPVSGDKTLRWYLCWTFEDRDLMSDPLACLMTEHVWKLDAKTRSVEKVDVKVSSKAAPRSWCSCNAQFGVSKSQAALYMSELLVLDRVL